MHNFTFDFPPELLLSKPTDFAKNFPNQGATILSETSPERKLIVCWDARSIRFIGPDGGVEYDWAFVQRISVEYNRKVMGRWLLAELMVWDHHGGHPVLYCEAIHTALFDQLIAQIRTLPLPISIE